MDRTYRDRDNISQTGRSIHTYTPQSHEDLLKSHLQIDATRQAKLQNDLLKLSSENDRLRNEINATYQDLQNKEDQINDLLSKLRNQPIGPSSVTSKENQQISQQVQLFEVDGKPVSLEYLINHFNVVIQRHHDLLNEKNKQIQELLSAQNKQIDERGPDRRYLNTQSQPKLNEFTNELAQVRREYEQVERILTERNNTLETLIADLRKNIFEYSTEISKLRNQLELRDAVQPRESMSRLLQEKEKENKRLMEIISVIKNQNQSSTYMGPESQVINYDLDNVIRTIIQGREDAINKLNHMIDGLNPETQSNTGTADAADYTSTNSGTPMQPNLEKECQDVLSDVNKVNEKLNSLLNKLQNPSLSKDITNKKDFISNLENLKKQCQEEIDKLKYRVSLNDKNKVVLRGQAVVSIDNSHYLRNKLGTSVEESEIPPLPIETPSNVEFNLYLPQDSKPYEPVRPLNQLTSPQPSYRQPYTQDTSKKYFPYQSVPCEACSAASFPFKGDKTPPTKPIISLTPTIISKEKIPQRPKTLVYEFYAPSDRALSRERNRDRSKGRTGCCGKQGSETSYYPYSKNTDVEKVVHVHNSYINQENNSTYHKVNNDIHDSPKNYRRDAFKSRKRIH